MKEHKSMGTMPGKKMGQMHASMGKNTTGNNMTNCEGKATSPSAGKAHGGFEGGGGAPAKMLKVRPASFGK